MSRYSRILVAVDCSVESKQILQAATQVQQQNPGSKVIITHVALDPFMLDMTGFDGPGVQAFDRDLIAKSGAEYLRPLIEQNNLDPESLTISFGHPATTILEQAEENNSDLIIAGSHGRRGLQVLLGSTASKLINMASCDVLVVRIREQQQTD